MSSILSDLAKKRQELLESDTASIVVPRWERVGIDVRLVVRPVAHERFSAIMKRAETAKKNRIATADVDAAADIVIAATKKVTFDGVAASEYGFDADLARALGETIVKGEEPTAREVLRKVILTDGDILAISSAVVEYSGYRDAKVADDLGN